MVMKIYIYKLTFILIIILYFYSCKDVSRRENQYHTTHQQISPFIEFSPATLGFMDELSSYIDIIDAKYNNECVESGDINHYIEVYEFFDAGNYYEDTSLNNIRFNNEGKYYIIVSLYNPNITDMYGFKYKNQSYVTSQILVDFFDGIQHINLNALLDMMEDDMQEEYDDILGMFTNWRFVVENGKIKKAVCISNETWYDLLTNREISECNFWAELPIPIKSLRDTSYNYRYYILH